MNSLRPISATIKIAKSQLRRNLGSLSNRAACAASTCDSSHAPFSSNTMSMSMSIDKRRLMETTTAINAPPSIAAVPSLTSSTQSCRSFQAHAAPLQLEDGAPVAARDLDSDGDSSDSESDSSDSDSDSSDNNDSDSSDSDSDSDNNDGKDDDKNKAEATDASDAAEGEEGREESSEIEYAFTPPPPLSKKSIQKVEDLFEQILHLDLIEVHLLTMVVNEQLGIAWNQVQAPGAGPVGGGAAGGAGAAEEEEAEEKLLWDIKLVGFDAKAKIKVIKEVRSIAGLGLKEAKELVESAPKIIQKELKPEKAEELKAQLEAVGAQIEIA